MQAAFLDEARPEDVAHVVQDVLRARNALITEHRRSRVRFRGLRPRPGAWVREGYVGVYQAYGEPEVEVRLLLRALWPHRLVWLAAWAGVTAMVGAYLFRPSGNTWYLLAFVTGFALLASGLVLLTTLKPVREEEAALMEAFKAAFAAHLHPHGIEDLDARRLHEAEAELEAEVVRRRIERARAAEKGEKPRFRLKPFAGRGGASAPDPEAGDGEALEARRQALLARKAALEAQGDEDSPR